MGTLIGSAVVPIAVCITWKKANGTGAIVGAIVGFVVAIAGWLGITAKLNGELTVDSTGGDYEVGRCASMSDDPPLINQARAELIYSLQ